MLKKTISLILSSMVLATAFVGCSSGNKTQSTGSTQTGTQYPKLKLKMSTTVSEQANAAITAKKFASLVSEASGGNITINVYPSDQLAGGNMSKGVEMLKQGGTDLAFEPVDVLSVLDQSLLALSMPWTFANYSEAKASLDGAGGQYIKKVLADKNLEVLGFIHNGFRQLTNNKRPIKTPEDLKGLKMRVPGGDVFVNLFKEFGADPVAMSFSELFTALQQGTVDGQENGFDLITSNKFYEVQKYLTLWNYSYGAFTLAFNKKTFDSFDENTKKLLREKAIEACNLGSQNVVNNEAKQKKVVADSGCQITELNEEQIKAFKSKLDNYYTTMKAKYGAEAVAAFGIK